jgi:hypothetical protein
MEDRCKLNFKKKVPKVLRDGSKLGKHSVVCSKFVSLHYPASKKLKHQVNMFSTKKKYSKFDIRKVQHNGKLRMKENYVTVKYDLKKNRLLYCTT